MLTTFPVAGSRPARRRRRGRGPGAGSASCWQDEKELSRAQHAGRSGPQRPVGRVVADSARWSVTEYQMIHRYSKIMHIWLAWWRDDLRGRLRRAATRCEAVLPAGTLSGAPKIRACEIIEELERRRRAAYTAARVGYLDFAGNMDTCIAIRMAVEARTAWSPCRRAAASWRTACRRTGICGIARTRRAPSMERHRTLASGGERLMISAD